MVPDGPGYIPLFIFQANERLIWFGVYGHRPAVSSAGKFKFTVCTLQLAKKLAKWVQNCEAKQKVVKWSCKICKLKWWSCKILNSGTETLTTLGKLLQNKCCTIIRTLHWWELWSSQGNSILSRHC